MIKKIGYFLVGLGLFVAVFSLSADLLGFGKGGIQATQLLGAQIGVITSLCGAAFIVGQKRENVGVQNGFTFLKDFVQRQPMLFLAVAGFILAYILFFFIPVFLDYRLQFQYFYRYLPSNVRIGLDIRTMMKYINYWLIDGKSPYLDDIVYYPPLYNVIFAPIALLGYPNSYYFMLAQGILSYFGLMFILPVLFSRKGKLSFLAFFALTGMFSYGLQFELERAQFNLITLFFCLFAVYLYHYHEDFRHFAYLFFSISVQLKVYPFIFIVMFIKDWRDWKNNLARMLGLSTFNFALLFILGFSVFKDFIRATWTQIEMAGALTWIGNHSIKAFVYNLARDGFGLFPESNLAWIRQNSRGLEIFLLIYVLACLGSIVVRAYWRKDLGLNSYLLAACTVGAMVIPSVSNDYKLAILAAPLSILFCDLTPPARKSLRSWFFLMLFLMSFAYSGTLYPFKYRPDFLANSFPFLLLILSALTAAYHLQASSNSWVPEPVPETAP